MINERASAIASKYLKDGEHILWSAQPRPTRPVAMAIGLAWLGFIVVGMVLDRNSHHIVPDIIRDVAALFSAGFLVFEQIRVYRRRRITAYAITDRRLIIVQDGAPKSLLSFQAIDPTQLEVRAVDKSGFGNVVVAERHQTLPDGRERVLQIRLLNVPDAEAVAEMLMEKFGIGDRLVEAS